MQTHPAELWPQGNPLAHHNTQGMSMQPAAMQPMQPGAMKTAPHPGQEFGGYHPPDAGGGSGDPYGHGYPHHVPAYPQHVAAAYPQPDPGPPQPAPPPPAVAPYVGGAAVAGGPKADDWGELHAMREKMHQDYMATARQTAVRQIQAAHEGFARQMQMFQEERKRELAAAQQSLMQQQRQLVEMREERQRQEAAAEQMIHQLQQQMNERMEYFKAQDAQMLAGHIEKREQTLAQLQQATGSPIRDATLDLELPPLPDVPPPTPPTAPPQPQPRTSPPPASHPMPTPQPTAPGPPQTQPQQHQQQHQQQQQLPRMSPLYNILPLFQWYCEQQLRLQPKQICRLRIKELCSNLKAKGIGVPVKLTQMLPAGWQERFPDIVSLVVQPTPAPAPATAAAPIADRKYPQASPNAAEIKGGSASKPKTTYMSADAARAPATANDVRPLSNIDKWMAARTQKYQSSIPDSFTSHPAAQKQAATASSPPKREAEGAVSVPELLVRQPAFENKSLQQQVRGRLESALVAGQEQQEEEEEEEQPDAEGEGEDEGEDEGEEEDDGVDEGEDEDEEVEEEVEEEEKAPPPSGKPRAPVRVSGTFSKPLTEKPKTISRPRSAHPPRAHSSHPPRAAAHPSHPPRAVAHPSHPPHAAAHPRAKLKVKPAKPAKLPIRSGTSLE